MVRESVAGLSVGDAEPQSYSVASQSAEIYATITAATGFEAEVGDALAIEWEYDNGFITYGGTVQHVAVSVSGATVSFRFPVRILERRTNNRRCSDIPARNEHFRRGPRSFTKVAVKSSDYYLPGFCGNGHSDIPIITTETILTNEGSKTKLFAADVPDARELQNGSRPERLSLRNRRPLVDGAARFTTGDALRRLNDARSKIKPFQRATKSPLHVERINESFDQSMLLSLRGKGDSRSP